MELIEKVRDAIDFCDMVLEIGEPDDTVIPVWPIETEMVVTHPLTVGMVRTFKAALEAKPTDAPAQFMDQADEALWLSGNGKEKPVKKCKSMLEAAPTCKQSLQDEMSIDAMESLKDHWQTRAEVAEQKIEELTETLESMNQTNQALLKKLRSQIEASQE